MGKGQRSAYEVMVIGIVVALALVMSAALYAGRSRIQKNDLLVEELSTVRRAIAVYRIRNQANPGSIGELAQATYDGGEGRMRPYLELAAGWKDSQMIDPFGRPYAYDPKIGWISSTSPGYERW